MTFGEKLKKARLAHGMTQTELARITGISERSLYGYEQMGKIPRGNNIKALAEALGVSAAYLMDDAETDTQKDSSVDIFLANVRNEYGARGAREASELLERASALFAGGELDEEAKEIFFRSMMEIYLSSKKEASDKFSPRQRAPKRQKAQTDKTDKADN